MSLAHAITATGPYPDEIEAHIRKRYSERLSKHLAWEVAAGLRSAGFAGVRPARGGPSDREFQGGLGPKRVDVSFSDERHGLKLAVSIKTICAAPYGKNLKNRSGDLLTEAITLHMRFPYSVVAAILAFPNAADHDSGSKISTFRRAMHLMGTASGRTSPTAGGEKFEHVAMLLFKPDAEEVDPLAARLFDAQTGRELSEGAYFEAIRNLYNFRNPHESIGAPTLDE